jgi:hypothetical protein
MTRRKLVMPLGEVLACLVAGIGRRQTSTVTIDDRSGSSECGVRHHAKIQVRHHGHDRNAHKIPR